MVLHITLSKETSVNDNSPVMFVLATISKPPELVLAADKVLIVGDFIIMLIMKKISWDQHL